VTGNQRGIALMMLVMAAFALEDRVIKLAVGTVPIGQAMPRCAAATIAAGLYALYRERIRALEARPTAIASTGDPA
jgi:hypothetical protein